jgi:hypothetical protein
MNAIKRIVATAGAASLIAASMAMPVLADGSSQASACGATHGGFADVYGNFGFLGEAGGTPGYHNGAVGQEAGATGSNNSSTGCQL